jgi:deoxyribonuclease-4
MAASAAWLVGYYVRLIGLHLRLTSNLTALIEKAIRLELPFFQCFLVHQHTKRLGRFDDEDVRTFLALRKNFKDIYLHGSYWINLSSVRITHHRSLIRELKLAHQLDFTHIVLHGGSAKGGKNKREGIEALARSLNNILKSERTVTFVLENSAHGRLNIGGDLQDYKLLLERLDYPDSISFCIDTAHAHSYGYSLNTEQDQEKFIETLESTIGIERIVLLHLNDTLQKCSSKMDKHEVLGEGMIGDEWLRKFVMHPKLAHIPIIMELPEMSETQEFKILEKVRSWHL